MAIRFPSFAEVGDKITRASQRFPMAMLAAVAGTLIFYYLIETKPENARAEQILRVVFAISLGLPLFVGLSVFSEKNSHAPSLKWGLQLLGLPVLAFACWAIDPGNNFREMHSLVWYFGLSFLFHLFVSFAAYLKKDDSVLDFWEFNKQLFINFLAGAVYSGVILAGLGIAIVAADQLFHIDFTDKIWGYLVATVLGLFQTVYFLSNFPADFEFDHSEIRYELVVKNLVKWILIPIVGLYFLILYAYSGKILATWQLPIGWVSWLMVGFSVAGIFTWLMNFMLPRFDSAGIISFFKKWFWPVMSPMLALLFVAVGRRINDYGLTEDRYLIAHLGMWLALMAAYFIFSKKDDIRVIPVSLAFFTIIYLMPGIGGMDAGIRAQTKILTGLLEKNGLLKDGNAVAQKEIFSGDDAARINDLVLFLAQRDAIEPISKWVGKPETDFKKEGNPYGASNLLAADLSVTTTYSPNESKFYRNYYHQNGNPLSELSVSGFDSLFQVDIVQSATVPTHGIQLLNDGHTIVFDGKNHEIEPILNDLWKKTSTNEPYLDSLDHIDFLGQNVQGRFVVNFMAVKMEDNKPVLESVSGWLLTKKNR